MKQTMKQIEEQNRNQNSKLNPRLNQKLEAVNQVYEMIDDIYDSYAGSFGITDAELWVLYALFEHNGDYLQTDICRQWVLKLVLSGIIIFVFGFKIQREKTTKWYNRL